MKLTPVAHTSKKTDISLQIGSSNMYMYMIEAVYFLSLIQVPPCDIFVILYCACAINPLRTTGLDIKGISKEPVTDM